MGFAGDPSIGMRQASDSARARNLEVHGMWHDIFNFWPVHYWMSYLLKHHKGTSINHVDGFLDIFVPPSPHVDEHGVLTNPPKKPCGFSCDPPPPAFSVYFSPQHRQYGAHFKENSEQDWNLKF